MDIQDEHVNKTLFDISREYIELLNEIEEAEGVLTEEHEEKLVISEKELGEKSKKYIGLIKYFESEIDRATARKEQIDLFIKRKNSRIEQLKVRLLDATKLFGKYEAGDYVVNTRKSESVEITNPTLLSEKYVVPVTTTKIDKKTIKSDLKNGVNVDGATLLKKENLSIR